MPFVSKYLKNAKICSFNSQDSFDMVIIIIWHLQSSRHIKTQKLTFFQYFLCLMCAHKKKFQNHETTSFFIIPDKKITIFMYQEHFKLFFSLFLNPLAFCSKIAIFINFCLASVLHIMLNKIILIITYEL